MARDPSPWYWKARDCWCITLDRKRIVLAAGKASKAEATARFHEIMSGRREAVSLAARGLTCRDLFNLFLAHVDRAVKRGEMEAVTFDGYQQFLISATETFGRLRVADLKPHHVNAWTDAEHPHRRRRVGGRHEVVMRTWGPTYRNSAITAVKRAFNWAVEEGHVEESPIAKMKKPTPRRREAIPSPEDAAKILAAAKGPLAELLRALRETGCRPGEVFELTAKGVNLKAGTWAVKNKTKRKTGQATREIQLTDGMIALSRDLIDRHPEGPIFRNSRGNPWTRNAVGWALNRLRTKLGIGPEAVAYAVRHLFGTDLRQAGVPDSTIATLMGHTDTKMIERVYGRHIDKRTDYLKEAVRKIVKPDDRETES